MANKQEKPKMVYDGDIEEFPVFWNYFIICLCGRKIKLKQMFDGYLDIFAYLMQGTLSNFPGKSDPLNSWNMAGVIDQHNIDRPDNQVSETL